ncbi:hypothetical protein BC936DRAFT_142669 [Jimgerdemannia flammicorona]|uniref:Methyltransferase type 11 domain-containing protein n=1 Tax=Jimgerdemannia flammicorona TaxID=994334 RepID=A0A433A041_9FUNG|nr:hypothetical protein BC936DRAFT_142669 [Jimgerdemannia flammicorona]
MAQTTRPSDDPLDSAKDALINIIVDMSEDQLRSFETFAKAALAQQIETVHAANHNHDHIDDVEDANHSHAFSSSSATHFVPVNSAKLYRLGRIIKDLRVKVPVSAEAPGEKIIIPETEEFAGYSDQNTQHVDSFLFTEDDVDELCDDGKLSRNYCIACGSRNTKPLSTSSLVRLFPLKVHAMTTADHSTVTFLFPSYSPLSDHRLHIPLRLCSAAPISLSSRPGQPNQGQNNPRYRLTARCRAIRRTFPLHYDISAHCLCLYFQLTVPLILPPFPMRSSQHPIQNPTIKQGYLFTDAKKLIGIELNEWFCNLQRDIIKKHRMTNRIEVIHADIQTHPMLLSTTSDIVIMNNVFQFFSTHSAQQVIWRFLKSETAKRRGLVMVTLPSLQEQLKEAGLGTQKFMKGWVKEETLRYDGGWFEEELDEEEIEEVKQVHLYRVV